MAEQNTTEAQRIQRSYAARVEGIRGRKDLSDDGRRRQLAKAYIRAATQMWKVRTEAEQTRARREEQLLRRLFGNPNCADATSVVSFRDAQDRAASLKNPEEALELLHRARRSGDHLLAKAIAMRAVDRARGLPIGGDGWGAVLDTWAEGQPSDVDQALTELGDLHREQQSTSVLHEGMRHSISRPSELSGVANVESLARDADANPGEDEPPDPLAGFGFDFRPGGHRRRMSQAG